MKRYHGKGFGNYEKKNDSFTDDCGYCHPQLVLKQQAASIMEDSLLHQQAG